MRRRALPAELSELVEAGRRLVTSHTSSLVRKRARRALRVEVAALLKRYELPGAVARLTHIPCPFCKAPMGLRKARTADGVPYVPAYVHLVATERVKGDGLQAVARWARLHREGTFRSMVIAAGMAADLGKKGGTA